MIRNTLFAALCVSIALPAASQDDAEAEQAFSYNVGVQVGRFLEPGAEDLDIASLLQGVEAVLGGEEIAVDEGVIASDWNRFQRIAETRRTEELAAAGREYIEAKAAEDGVTVTGSGLLYRVIEEGDGASPSAADTVTVHYRGTFIDGSEFDSSYSRNEPTTFPLSGVIPGWTEGVQLMKVGSKYEFYIPFNLAYGPQGRPPTIPPYSTLVFEIELIAIEQP